MGAEGIQVETPKLVRSTDGLAVHDAPVTLLQQPMRVSQLVARDFEELSRMAGLCAPCPREPPPCGTGWLSLMQTSHIYSLDWSQERWVPACLVMQILDISECKPFLWLQGLIF
jgi:hypothetical protein